MFLNNIFLKIRGVPPAKGHDLLCYESCPHESGEYLSQSDNTQ